MNARIIVFVGERLQMSMRPWQIIHFTPSLVRGERYLCVAMDVISCYPYFIDTVRKLSILFECVYLCIYLH